MTVENSFTWMHLCTETHHNCSENQTVWECISSKCRQANTLYVTALAIMGVIITFSNMVVLTVYLRRLYRKSEIEKSSMSQVYYKLSLAVADLLMGLLVCNLSIVNFFNSFRSLETWERLRNSQYMHPDSYDYETIFHSAKAGSQYHVFLVITGGITFTSLGVSMYTLLACSADRLYSVVTLKHSHRRVSCMVIPVIWLVCVITAMSPFMTNEVEYGGWVMIFTFTSTTRAQLVIMGSIFFPLLGMWTINIIIYFVLRRRMSRMPPDAQRALYTRHVNENEPLDDSVSISPSTSEMSDFQPENYVSRTIQQAEYYFSVTLAIIVGGFTICFLPMAIAIAMSASVDGQRSPSSENLIFWFGLLCVSNSFWNCIIYSIRNKDFRYETKLIMKLLCNCIFTCLLTY